MKAYLKFIISMLIFGSIGIFVKQISLPSSLVVLARTVGGGVLLTLVLVCLHKKVDKEILKKNLLKLVLAGLSLGFGWLFLFESYKYTSVSLATLTYYLAPVIVILLSPIILKEKLNGLKIFGVIIAMLGMIIISNISSLGISVGTLYGVIAALLYALLMIINKLIKDIDGLVNTIIELFVAAIVIAIYSLSTINVNSLVFDDKTIICLIMLCIIHTALACYLYFSSMQELSGQTIAILSYIDPLSALFFSAIFLGDSLSGIEIIGSICILLGSLIPIIKELKLIKR